MQATRRQAYLHAPRTAYIVRFASDTRTTTDAKSSAPASTPPPPSAPRKPKVDLHPAPVKPPPTSSTPPPSTPKAEQEQEKPRTLIEMAQYDVRDAEAHGVLLPPPPTAGKIGRFFFKAWELAKFYARGVRLVYRNWLRARELAARDEPLTRFEARFIAQARRDLIKTVPFVLTIIVIEELIPLIILYAPGMLPSTCVLPSQRERIERNRREKQATTAAIMAPELRAVLDAGVASIKSVRDGQQLIALCKMLSLNSFGIPSTRAARVERHLARVVEDDARLKAEGNGTRLTQPELYEALEERGIVTFGLEPRTALARLTWWLREVDADGEGDAVGRRVQLISRGGLGRF